MKMIYISWKPIRKIKKRNCTSRNPYFKKVKIGSCAGDRVSDLGNQKSFE